MKSHNSWIPSMIFRPYQSGSDVSRIDGRRKLQRRISLYAGGRETRRRNGYDLGKTAGDPGSGRTQQ
ncbi:hypothetical protein GALL_480800 [mine drainage metagenome]|uniref:Uncharacterized protein n=1 Tax=mine drainage metagenome TaxID=410659 RepID=A0A1J5PRU6_9ZZZZ